MYVNMYVCMRACVRVRACGRARVRERACARARACVCVCVCGGGYISNGRLFDLRLERRGKISSVNFLC